MTTEMRPFIAKAALGSPLDAADARAAFEIIMSGEATPAQIGGFLMALRVRGETPEEIAAAARVMRDKAVTIDAPAGAIDCCGTGGDNSGSFNVSTAVSFVLAGAGVTGANVWKTESAALDGSHERCLRANRHW